MLRVKKTWQRFMALREGTPCAKRTQLLRARVSDPHRLTRLFSTESEYERKLRHVGRPFLGISTEKNVENASTVETHPNFAGVLPWHHVACQKNMAAFHGFARGNTYFRHLTPDRHLMFVL